LDENAPFICIEPWFGYSDVESTGNLMERRHQIIDPEQTFEAKFSIEIL
jgi:galactose mutarotase-like enzyme